MTPPPLGRALAAAAVGGVLGSLARYGLTEWHAVGTGFPWTVFAINVVGSALLAALPAFAVVRRSPLLGVFLGTGVMGGFTTMSAASAETVTLFEHNRDLTAFCYVAGTLVAALVAVAVVDRWSTAAARADAEESGVDE
ncbi:fluoride efflux transporter FluC [Nocardioides marmorisolisilvae]|uniref:Fluoride-specific ion channel FluC n=1 Tax=Nocardioides marmorisolisilvae TaxID=1542737 RepID=A0A3N0DPY6_9ACTN|nr:CrcB family protein [Nocardioides marmorisolisilvae]RNL77541.1 CrcB family protein [Nocardioides marmorisolisilvae]